jgi:hypothetical protein
MADERKEKRKKLMAFTPVHDQEKNILLGYLGDLTMKGALVIGEKPLETDTLTTLAFDFPETPEFPGRRVFFPVRIAWSKREPEAEYYDSGVEFQELSDENTDILKSILERYQYRHVMS